MRFLFVFTKVLVFTEIIEGEEYFFVIDKSSMRLL